MRITEIRQTTVPIRSDMKNAYISFSEMTVSLVAVVSDVVRDGRTLVGFGFNSNGRYSQAGILSDRMIPRLLNANSADLASQDGTYVDPRKAWQAMMLNEKPGGHGERSVAAGVLDMALWDLASKCVDMPLYQFIRKAFGPELGISGEEPSNRIFVYAAGGYYDAGKGIAGLKDEMKSYLDSGYTTLKMKIGGATLSEDLRRIEAVLSLLPSGEHLAVDANGRFDRAQAVEYAFALAPYRLKWYEEPGDPLDFEVNKAVCAQSAIPIATGENIFSHQDVRNLLRYGGMNPETDFLQMDPALSYGLTEYVRMLHVLLEQGWSPSRCIPHGGHQFGLQLSAGLGLYGNESYPGIFKPFGGFADGVKVEDGTVRNPNLPGIGIEQKAELYELCRELLA
ncbi:MAG TPA: mandelate racemase/muconate lactonizing enzyme family protein [Spirochaetia bacterium]|nr:mandelate racemase/muconate lactonizing enzyme family protein [Spirochaetia bacterium]